MPRRSLQRSSPRTVREFVVRGPRSRRTARRPIRFAVVGIGYFAQAHVLPAFKQARDAELVALVSDDPVKLRKLGRKFKVPILTDYEHYPELLASGDIDAVYIVTPHDLHTDFAMLAAREGIHVLCEKPLAITSEDCEAMVEECRRANVRLMTAYRLHYQPGNLAAIKACHDGSIGDPRVFDSVFSFQVAKGNTRTQADHGGGPLWDIGIYCINAARYIFRDEPTEVTAFKVQGDDRRFKEVEEGVGCIMRFPGERVATFTVSYGVSAAAFYTVMGTKGYVCLDEAYELVSPMVLEIGTGERTRTRKFPKTDQVAPEIVRFCEAVRTGKDPEPSGKEGLIDVRIIEAIRESIRTGKAVAVHGPTRTRRPTRRQRMTRPGHAMPKLIHAQTPSRGGD